MRRPPRSTLERSSAASDGYKRQALRLPTAIVGAAPPDPSEFNGFNVENASVPLEAILRGGPPRDGIPSIDRPRFVSAAQAGLADDDRLLGLGINGHARAYPVRILNWPEVVNDRFGDCLLYTSPSPRDRTRYRMPSFACKKKKKNNTHNVTISLLS